MKSLTIHLPLLLASSLISGRAAVVIEADVCVYGGTTGGVAAAVQTSRMGKTALIAEFGRHIDGLTSGGLGATDIGNKAAIGGLSREFYARVAKHYANVSAWLFETREDYFRPRRSSQTVATDPTALETMWTFEPNVAENIFWGMLNEANVPVYLDQRLASVKKEGSRIREIATEGGKIFRAKVF